MDRLTALEHHLCSLTPEQVAEVLSGLPQDVGEPPGGLPRDALVELLSLLRPQALDSLTAAQTDLLTAAADAAADEAPSGARDQALLFMGPVRNARVDGEALLARIGASEGEGRRAVWEVMSQLLAAALLWPDGRGGYHLATGLVEVFAGEEEAPGVDDALTQSYNLPELRRIALALGLDPTRRRASVQADAVARLTDPAHVRALLEQAPPGAAEYAHRLAWQSGVLATYCFEGGGFHGEGTYRFRPEGSGDPDTDWLAERGLLVPCAPERAILPREVARAVRAGSPMPFDARPPALTGEPVDAGTVAGQAQTALVAALAAADRLVAELTERPAAVRKAGGLTVRDRRRLAGALDTTPELAALWTELALSAELLEVRDQRVAVSRRGAAWTGLAPAERLEPLLDAWVALPDVPTWQPVGQEPSTPGEAVVPGAVPLRQGLLLALASLPTGAGSGVTPRSLTGRDEGHDPRLEELLQALLWHRPAARQVEEIGPVMAHTLEEAEVLGATVRGAATPLGRALAEGGGATLPALAGLLPPTECEARFQGDMTATVTGTPGADLEHLLSAVADREGGGYASTWRLTASSVRRALDAGHTADELVERLSRIASGGSLPQTMEYLVRDTARGHGRMRILPARCVVRCEDAALAEELAGHRGLRGLGLRAVAETVLVSAEPSETALTVLRAQGYAPVTEDATGDTVVERASGGGGGEPVPGRRERLLALARDLTGHG